MNKNPKENKPEKKLVENFQQLGKNNSVPEELKEEVFGTLDTLNLFADIADLFTLKFSMTEFEAISTVTELADAIDIKKEIENNQSLLNNNTKKPSEKNKDLEL